MSTSDKRPEETSARDGSWGSARVLVIGVIVVAAALALWLLPLRQYVVHVLEWTEGLGSWGPVVVALFYVVACVAFLPGSIITLGAGLLFGVTKGFITVWIGSNLGACAAFLVGRTLARDWVAKRVAGNPKFAAIDDAVGREGFKIVLLLRLSPVFPFNLLNYALGLTNVPFHKYAPATLVGMIPGILLYVYLGSAARSLAEVAAGKVEGGLASKVFFIVGLIVTFAVVALVTKIARRSLADAEARAKTAEPPKTETGQSSDGPAEMEVHPLDEHNEKLVANTRPTDWTNPDPKGRYNLVVIGAGTAGLVTAAAAAGLGARVALVEKSLLGGDCLNVGCVPSKSIIRSSRAAAEAMRAVEYGVRITDGVRVDFPAVMERMRSIRARISTHDSAARFRDLGVDVYFGPGRFIGPDAVEVGAKTLRFKRAMIATGARAVHPKIDGLSEAGFLTNETVFSLTDRPDRLAVIGGGPIGCEMAQAFRRLGSAVVLFHRNAHILDREDPDAAEIIQKRFESEGIRLVLNAKPEQVEVRDGKKIIHYSAGDRHDSIAVDEILVGAGRQPNVEGLGLDAAGVEFDQRAGVIVDDRLRTSNPAIYAAGDICMRFKFTHAADAAARIVVQNALFLGRRRLSALTVPWCTYTNPEIAHVGMYERDAAKLGVEMDTFVRPLAEVDRAVTDGEEDGFVKIHVKKGTDRILGATIVATHAGEMINEITLAMTGGLGLRDIGNTIHPYPTQSEAIKHVADAYNRTRLTPRLKRLFEKWLEWTR